MDILITFDDNQQWLGNMCDTLDTLDGTVKACDIRIGDNIYCCDNIIRIVTKVEKYRNY